MRRRASGGGGTVDPARELAQRRGMRCLTLALSSMLLAGASCGDDAEAGESGLSGLSGLSGVTTATTGASGATSGATTGASDTETGGGGTSTSGAGTGTSAGTSTSGTSTSTSTTGGSSGDPSGTTGGEPSLCAPAGNIIEPGSLDGGMSGAAPVGWEVRSPGKDQECAGSGPHVFASAAAPGCEGGGITIDAKGAWDCYAVQTVSGYNTIEGGATYVIRAAARSEGNAVNPAAWFILGVQWLDGNDAFFGDEKNPKPADSADNDFEWKVIEWEVQAPANARRILVWMTAHHPGRVDYDHVAVIKKG